MIDEKKLTIFFSALSMCIFHSVFGLYFSTCIVLRIQMRGRPVLDCMWFGGTLQNDLAVHMQNRQSCGQSQFAKNLPTNIFDFKRSVAGPEPDPHGSRISFGSRRAKMAHKIEKMKKFLVLKYMLDVLFLRAEGFSCSSNVWRPRDK
jgi:hypothetical protein